MEKPISVGDLVQVVRWPCCGAHLGKIFRVTLIRNLLGSGSGCFQCRRPGFPVDGITAAFVSEYGFRAPLPYLKRIPPLEELEGERRDEKLKEPA